MSGRAKYRRRLHEPAGASQAVQAIEIGVARRVEWSRGQPGEVRRIAVRSEYPRPTPPQEYGGEGRHPFPDGLAARGYLEHPARGAFTDQHVAIGLALGTGDVATEELLGRLAGVLPDG